MNREEAKPQAKYWRAASKNMRRGKWLSMFFIMVCLVLTIVVFNEILTQ
ncbi:hypothetical protein [Colwellia sp.]|nr:hypothetical protein [Colwellia sp.]